MKIKKIYGKGQRSFAPLKSAHALRRLDKVFLPVLDSVLVRRDPPVGFYDSDPL